MDLRQLGSNQMEETLSEIIKFVNPIYYYFVFGRFNEMEETLSIRFVIIVYILLALVALLLPGSTALRLPSSVFLAFSSNGSSIATLG